MTQVVDKKLIASALNEAANDLVQYGWAPEAGDWYTDYRLRTDPGAVCVWQATMRAADRLDIRGIASIELIDEAVMKAAGVQNIGQLFNLNDSKSESEGLLWALGVLLDARDIVYPEWESEDKLPIERNWFTRKVVALKERLTRKR